MRGFWVSACYLECNNPGGCSQKRFLLIALTYRNLLLGIIIIFLALGTGYLFKAVFALGPCYT